MLVEYIMYVYAPCFFNAKYKSSIVFAPIYLAEIIKKSRFLPARFQKVVNDTIQRNGYYAHPENVLVAMLNDDNVEVRLKAWRKILQARQNKPIDGFLRPFTVPKINFNCIDYIDMIDLENTEITSPPILKGIEVSLDNLEE